MNEKLKIFKVVICQSFDYCYYEYSWFRKKIKKDRYNAYGKIAYILAKSETEAVELYKQRYKWMYDKPIEILWRYSVAPLGNGVWLPDNPNFEHEVVAIEIHPSFETLKNELRAEELLAFCKQEMYPIEELIK